MTDSIINEAGIVPENMELPQDETIPSENAAETQETETIQKISEALSRATADYQNLLKRTESERKDMANFFTENFVKKILPTLDNLERVVNSTPVEFQTDAVYEGVKHAAVGLNRTLESMGVSSFVSIGCELDPSLHEALSQAPGEVWKIISEFEKGYKLGEKVIRHAKVIVGNGDSPSA